MITGAVPATDYLKLLESYEHETDYNVWSDILGGVGTLSGILEDTEYDQQFDSYVRSVFINIARKLGWDEKSDEGNKSVQFAVSLLSFIVYTLQYLCKCETNVRTFF